MDTKVKKRGWVKNAAIIFLAVMLVLTFFSSTIMNRSLPEVTAQYVESGAVTTRIRGTGKVEANETYELKVQQSVTVESVAVKVGDPVEVGDTIMYLDGDASTELEEAQNALEELELAYQKALVSATDSDYAKENRDIQNARDDLSEAEAERDALYISDEEIAALKAKIDEAEAAISTAKANVAAAQKEADAAQAAVDAKQEELSALGGLDYGSSGDYSAVESAKNAMNEANAALKNAENELAAKRLIYGEAYDAFYKYADENKGNSSVEVYMKYLDAIYAKETLDESAGNSALDLEGRHAQHEAYTVINEYTRYVSEAKSVYNNAVAAYNSAVNSYNNSSTAGNSYEWNKLNKELTELKSTLSTKKAALTAAQDAQTDAENSKTEAQAEYDKAQERKTNYEAAVKNVRTCQNTLEDLIFALSEQQKADGNTQALEALDLNAQRRQIEKKTEEVEKLRNEGVGRELVSKVAGTVRSIAVSAGDTAQPDTALASIEVTDRGYSLSFSVTTEQSRRVSVGDTAEVSNYYWGNDLTATITGIRTDPENPQTSKVLTFSISGEVESGTELSLSVGQRSANYDMLVPNSAVRSDSNGDFVLIVVAKNSPIGNRYVVQRADVTVLASDDSKSAVSGALTNSDYVITASTKPVEAGMQVRIAD